MSLNKEVVIFNNKSTINFVYKKISILSGKVKFPGIAIIINEKNKIDGVVTDGDFRRAYIKGINFNKNIRDLMISDPILININTPNHKVENIVNRKINKLKRLKYGIRHVIFVDSKKQFVKIEYYENLQNVKKFLNKIAIFGLGYVGLTLAAHISNREYNVIGIEKNLKILENLNKNKIHVFEPGLKDFIKLNKYSNFLKFENKLYENADIYIITVGTPIKNKMVETNSIKNVVINICKYLKKNDQIMLRSTVEVGTTRNLIIPLIFKLTKLKAGEDYNISFVPERTAEGVALKELKSIPQIVGGYSKECVKKSSDFWGNFSSSVVQVKSIEEAELIKLANNTFRDLSFSFSNELGLICQKYNINAFDLINSANSGYKRNQIPSPSPGVGGYCLTKDPLIYSKTAQKNNLKFNLGEISRKVNDRSVKEIFNLIRKFSKFLKLELKSLNILIVGVAFKGVPENNDTRDSIAIKIKDLLSPKVNKIYAWDAIINKKDLISLGFKNYNSIINVSNNVDVVLILNNNPKNFKNLFLKIKSKNKLIYDGWSLFNSQEVEKIKKLSYSTIGYEKFKK